MNAILYRAANAYANVDLETSVQSANPHRLILMLFEAAILSVSKAQRYMETDNIPMKGMAISKAIQIIDEGLKASLDENQGGDMATQLKDLYVYMSHRLLLASMRNEPEGLAVVAGLLTDLKDAWAAIGQEVQKNVLDVRPMPQSVAA
jgi:flagellar secretion chaperone FliS